MALVLWIAAAAAGQTENKLDNQGILKMKAAGFDDPTIIKAIESTPGQYDTSVDALIALKTAGVSGSVIAAMLQQAGAKKPPAASPQPGAQESSPYPEELGVYYLKQDRCVPVEPETLTMKTTGVLGRAFSYGISSAKIKGWGVGKTSKTRLSPSIELLLKLPEGTAPTEYQILDLEEKDDRREVELGRARFNVSTSTHRSAISFQHERVAKGAYRLTVQGLKRGEYGILPPGATVTANAASLGKIYTFGVE